MTLGKAGERASDWVGVDWVGPYPVGVVWSSSGRRSWPRGELSEGWGLEWEKWGWVPSELSGWGLEWGRVRLEFPVKH